MSEIEEAIEILNWTQRATKCGWVKLNVSKPGSPAYHRTNSFPPIP